jgi:Domain of unknown function (DUF1707)
MRAADSDRQYVADRLREALDEGRLDLGEYDDRLKDTYAARTYGELDKVLHDLPTVAPPEQSQVARVAQPAATTARATRRRGHPWLWAIWGGWVSTSLIMIVIWVLFGSRDSFWPLWVILPWGAILLARTIGALVSGDPTGHAEAELQRQRERRDERRDRQRERRDRRRYG